jgi:hypothetical protein
MTTMLTNARFAAGITFPEFLAAAVEQPEFWRSSYERAKVPDDLLDRARAMARPLRLAVLLEDWCGDATNTMPLLARFAEQVPGWELRVFARDANPDLMDAHLTGTSRSIPVVMLLNEHGEELAWWGPRPRELQDWVLTEGQSLEKAERYKHVRRWYALDRGRTTISEILDAASDALSVGGIQ